MEEIRTNYPNHFNYYNKPKLNDIIISGYTVTFQWHQPHTSTMYGSRDTGRGGKMCVLPPGRWKGCLHPWHAAPGPSTEIWQSPILLGPHELLPLPNILMEPLWTTNGATDLQTRGKPEAQPTQALPSRLPRLRGWILVLPPCRKKLWSSITREPRSRNVTNFN